MSRPVTVAVLDDHVVWRRGMEIVLSAADGIELLGGFDCVPGEDVVIDLRPDVVLIGAGRLNPAADATCTRVRAALPGAGIVMLAGAGLFMADVDGCLAREAPLDDLTGEILRVAQRH